MPINFPQIAGLLQTAIAEKLSFQEFINFEEASTVSREVAQSIRTKIEVPNVKESSSRGTKTGSNADLIFELNNGELFLHFNNLWAHYSTFMELKHFRFNTNHLEIRGDFTASYCQSVTNFMRLTQSTTSRVSFGGECKVCCTPELWNHFLETASVEMFGFKGSNRAIVPFKLGYVQIPAIKQLRVFEYTGYAGLPLEDEDFLRFKAERMELSRTKVTSRGINQMLKEYLQGTRNIESIKLAMEIPINVETVFDGVPHIVRSDLDTCWLQRFEIGCDSTSRFIEMGRYQITIERKCYDHCEEP